MSLGTETDARAARNGNARNGKLNMLVLIAVAVVAVAGGFFVPGFLSSPASSQPTAEKKDSKKPAILQFGDVVVNLGEERLTRYLRVKLLLVVDAGNEKETNDLLTKQKAYLKNWLIGYLSDLSLPEVSRAAGVNRVRREVRDQFNAMLYPDGSEKILEVLLDEFVVQ